MPFGNISPALAGIARMSSKRPSCEVLPSVCVVEATAHNRKNHKSTNRDADDDDVDAALGGETFQLHRAGVAGEFGRSVILYLGEWDEWKGVTRRGGSRARARARVEHRCH